MQEGAPRPAAASGALAHRQLARPLRARRVHAHASDTPHASAPDLRQRQGYAAARPARRAVAGDPRAASAVVRRPRSPGNRGAPERTTAQLRIARTRLPPHAAQRLVAAPQLRHAAAARQHVRGLSTHPHTAPQPLPHGHRACQGPTPRIPSSLCVCTRARPGQ